MLSTLQIPPQTSQNVCFRVSPPAALRASFWSYPPSINDRIMIL